MQLKVFARVQGKPQTWDENDKIFVSLAYGYENDDTRYETPTLQRLPVGEPLMVASFILLSILSGLVVMWLTTAYYSKIWSGTGERDSSTNENANKKQKFRVHFSLYQATALVFSCFNICNFGTFVIALLFKYPDLGTKDCWVDIAFKSKLGVVLLLCMVHLLVAISAVRVPKQYLCHLGSFSGSYKWCICCRIAKCLTSNTAELEDSIPCLLKWKTCQTLALFNILVFLQTIGVAFIPIFVFLLLYTFRVLSVLVFMASSTFCLVVFVATLLQFDAATSRYKTKLFLEAMITFFLFVFLGVIVALYLFMLSHGLHTGGLEGFLLSLLPSLILTGLGWGVKSKMLYKIKKIESS